MPIIVVLYLGKSIRSQGNVPNKVVDLPRCIITEYHHYYMYISTFGRLIVASSLWYSGVYNKYIVLSNVNNGQFVHNLGVFVQVLGFTASPKARTAVAIDQSITQGMFRPFVTAAFVRSSPGGAAMTGKR